MVVSSWNPTSQLTSQVASARVMLQVSNDAAWATRGATWKMQCDCLKTAGCRSWMLKNVRMVKISEDAKDFALKIGDSWKHNPSKKTLQKAAKRR